MPSTDAERLPTTVRELWDTGWVAENEDDAVAQAERMFDLFHGKEVEVDRLTFGDGDDYDDPMFVEPWPKVWVEGLSTESGWDGDVIYPEWYVRPVDPDQKVISISGKPYRMGELGADVLTTTAPGIGTAAGFGRKDRLIYPVPPAHIAEGTADNA